jgi:predicted metalloprotease with PDZ domain
LFRHGNTSPVAALVGLAATVLCLTSGVAALAAPPKSVAYTVSVADTTLKKYRVTARAEGVSDENVTFALPAWTPGWYVRTNAWKNVSNVAAKSETGKPLTVSHPDNYTWTVKTDGAKSVTLVYDLLAKNQDPEAIGPGGPEIQDFGFFAPYLDDQRGFVPGPAALVYVDGGKETPHKVTYSVPKGWRVATANDPTSDPLTFSAKDYDTLADHPADLGDFYRVDKKIDGKDFSVVLVNANESGSKRFIEACWKIARAGMKVFKSAPFPRYIFHFHLVETTPVMMGLEHLNSTIIALPKEAVEDMDKTALSIVAHEYVHAWNVKRIRSEALGPFDYTKEVRTRDLWWLEGVTDYYAPRLMVEAGLAGPDFWRGYMQEQITDLQNNASRQRVTLETASLKAWEGKSEGFDGLSYYNKGLVVGLLLDVEMRRRTGNKVGLDDLMQALFEYVSKNGKGFPDGEIERIASRLVGSDLTPFFEKTLRSTEELDYEGILPAAGFDVRVTKRARPELGLVLEELAQEGDNIKIGALIPGGPAEKAGMKPGDVIETINGRPVLRAIVGVLRNAKVGEEIKFGILRDGKKEEITLALGEAAEVSVRLAMAADPTPEQKAIYGAISGGANVPKTVVGE